MAKHDKAAQQSTETAMTAQPKAGALALSREELGVEDAGQGYERQDERDRKTPFIMLLQGQSKAVKPRPDGTDSPHRPGYFHNTGTDRSYPGMKGGVLIVPVVSERKVLEFTPIDDGGGFHGAHEIDSEIFKHAVREQEERKRRGLPGGDFGDWWTGEPKKSHELIETVQMYAVHVDGLDLMPVVVPFASMKLKHFKAWNNKMNWQTIPVRNERGEVVEKFKPPMRAFLTRITSWLDKQNNNDFFNVTIEPANGDFYNESDPSRSSFLPKSDPRRKFADAMYEAWKAGKVAVDYSKMQDDAARGNRGDAAADADIPF